MLQLSLLLILLHTTKANEWDKELYLKSMGNYSIPWLWNDVIKYQGVLIDAYVPEHTSPSIMLGLLSAPSAKDARMEIRQIIHNMEIEVPLQFWFVLSAPRDDSIIEEADMVRSQKVYTRYSPSTVQGHHVLQYS